MYILVPFFTGFCARIAKFYLEKTVQYQAIFRYGIYPRFEHCGVFSGLSLEDSRTNYSWQGKLNDAKNPNRDRLLCEKCTELHHEFWDEQWRDYYAGRL